MKDRSTWEWFGNAGHFICSRWCQFHLCTLVGDFLVSTVGQFMPDESVREIFAKTRGVTLVGRGDTRLADYMKKIGFEEVGYQRTYETMVFVAGPRCVAEGCGCGQPSINGHERDFQGYSDAASATRGHLELCAKWSVQIVADLPTEE